VVGRNTNFELKFTHAFKDHHVYEQSDIDALETQARGAGVDAFLTTAKDAVKLGGLNLTLPYFVVEIELVLENVAEFEAML
jgi:tetraacyldisaccharide-1-P 4'-kinase